MVKLKNTLVKGNRSQAEQILIDLLRFKFKKLKILPNDKSAIKRELDVYLPDYKIAIEIDGICHWKAIYGEETLAKVQIRDKKKSKLCEDAGITLFRITLPDDSRAYFTHIKKELTEVIAPAISEIISRQTD